MEGPRYPLSRVKALAREGKLFVQRTRALESLAVERGGYAAAMAFVARAIEALGEHDFVETVHLTWDVADVYGLRFEDAAWYAKLYVDEKVPETTVISFHPLGRPIRRRGGWLKPGGKS